MSNRQKLSQSLLLNLFIIIIKHSALITKEDNQEAVALLGITLAMSR